ncbi:MAG: helix-turn-helix transcriptional regulator [Candidatus Heimdallarchaeota archaeon]|nr:helix-turn-helix transcriptional regulator [Candidatus Heimdallarchaeota archaeon]
MSERNMIDLYQNKIPIYKIINSVGKLKIIDILVKYNELNVTRISKLAGLNHSNTNKLLYELREDGIIMEKRYGRIRIFKINTLNPYGKKLSDLIKSW